MALLRVQALHPGERTNPEGKPVGNKILLSIPDSEYRLIRPHLKFINFPNHLSLHHPHHLSKFAYFPNEGLVSLVVELKDGKAVEAGLLGNEGAAGMPGIFGLRRNPLREIVQISGHGFRASIREVVKILDSAPQLQIILCRYAAGLGMQIAQTAACNRLHNIEQRLARWLLLAQDRVDSGFIPITHDFLATMLGTDRPTVSLAAGILQKHSIIQYTRGAVRILNRKRLEDFACECYGVIRQYNGNNPT